MRRRPLQILPALLACLLLALTGCSAANKHSGTRAGGAHSAAPAASAPGQSHGLPTIAASQLPPEARHTLQLIAAGGPFPYPKDGVVFGKYENVLPRERRGYYHEYTVPTPGARDRGARRIVTGSGHETYYTDDHYRTFKAVTGR
ncbi:ribonuclease domain-containing protein [Streptantibioticus ferralitis]|uniref:Ribonuclease domain-containing protein n=1 Tax=Streptantibioticus ferralitis TaxID=236510 RepID=A0ABT5Z5T7_9ACTN|nr:ribonuclease domain-containing protein [Streptantibioticus ferralitis]MDF2259192.1 ribonuclease domain-containing protein [Streptantibioticus ferralitis]